MIQPAISSYSSMDRMIGYEPIDPGSNPGMSALVPWSKG